MQLKWLLQKNTLPKFKMYLRDCIQRVYNSEFGIVTNVQLITKVLKNMAFGPCKS